MSDRVETWVRHHWPLTVVTATGVREDDSFWQRWMGSIDFPHLDESFNENAAVSPEAWDRLKKDS